MTVAVAVLVLSLPGTAAAAEVRAPIDSADTWQYSNAYVSAGQIFTVYTDSSGPDGKAGRWTVDYRSFPHVGPNGYDPSTDAKIYQGCKVVSSLPYARLLGRIGEHGGVFSVGTGGRFRASTGGALYMRINDQDRCRGDNLGYIAVAVS